jgi:MFS family permease
LTDVSSEMIFTLLPFFLSNVLGATTTVIGFIGGLSDSADAFFRILSGRISDRIGNRKKLTVLGYGISAILKPLMYVANNWTVVTGIRFGDRVGKGLRSAPRDALISESVQPAERGRSFGIHRAMDTAGAFIGLVLAALLIHHVQGGGLELTRQTYRWIVLIGVMPAVLAVAVLIAGVKEPEKPAAGHAFLSRQRSWGFDARFKAFLAIVGIFTLGRSGEFFVMLRAQNLAVPLIQTVLMLILFNAVYAAVSTPAGVLSDRLGRKSIIVTGWLVYALVYLGFALASRLWQVWILFAGWGVYNGLFEGVARAYVADLVPVAKRGTAYGLYYFVSGIVLLPAGVVAGRLWQAIQPAAPFFFGAAMALLAAVCLTAFVRK